VRENVLNHNENNMNDPKKIVFIFFMQYKWIIISYFIYVFIL